MCKFFFSSKMYALSFEEVHVANGSSSWTASLLFNKKTKECPDLKIYNQNKWNGFSILKKCKINI